jgi:hypothetical protein
VRLGADCIIAGQFIKAGTPIAGLRELPPLEPENGRPANSNGQWVAVEGADSEVLQGHDLKNKRAYLRLKARMEVDPLFEKSTWPRFANATKDEKPRRVNKARNLRRR